MSKNATVSARVEADLKHEAEDILHRLGIPVSVVINSLYRQIIVKNGIPFDMTLPREPKTLDTLSKTDLDNMLSHSYARALAGEGRPLDEVFDEILGSLDP